MGVSEVLLCPYRCLEYKMERLEKLKISAIVSFNNSNLALVKKLNLFITHAVYLFILLSAPVQFR